MLYDPKGYGHSFATGTSALEGTLLSIGRFSSERSIGFRCPYALISLSSPLFLLIFPFLLLSSPCIVFCLIPPSPAILVCFLFWSLFILEEICTVCWYYLFIYLFIYYFFYLFTYLSIACFQFGDMGDLHLPTVFPAASLSVSAILFQDGLLSGTILLFSSILLLCS